MGLVSFDFDFVDVVDVGNGAEAAGTWISGESPLFWLLFFFFAMIKIYLQLDWKIINHGNTKIPPETKFG